MKKVLFATFVIAAIASCTKNDVIPVENDSLEIKFQTVVGPQTKALGSGQVAYAGDAFYSTAFYLEKAKEWATDSDDAVVYLNDKIIGSSGTPKTWAAATSYYWPKSGKLTFMSYAILNSSNVYLNETSTAVTADNTDGVTVPGFNVNTTYKDCDLLVAAIASDKTANEDIYLTNGVPTLFGHKLCKLAINAQTDTEYSTKEFNITSITINDLHSVGTYNMNPAGVESWSADTPDDVIFFNGPVEINTTKTPITAAQSVYIPQDFQDTETITVNYTITNTTGVSFVENVSVTKKLSEIFTAGWQMNTIYTLDLTFSLNTILWDPAQTDWTNGTNGSMAL